VSRVLEILRREYLENVRTKAFLVGLVLTPVWMGLVFLVPSLVERPESERVVIVDETGELGRALAESLEASRSPVWQVSVRDPIAMRKVKSSSGKSALDELREMAGRGDHFLVVLTPPILEKRPPREGEHSSLVAGPSGAGALQTATGHLVSRVNDLVNRRIAERRGFPPETVDLLARDAVRYQPVDEKGEQVGAAGMIAPILFMMLLFMGIVGISQMLISSTLEEKTNRVFEILLSSVSAFQLMLGKILGICAVGLTLLVLWSAGGLVAASVKGLDGIVDAPQIAWFLVYYVLGFLLIASLMVAVGSACNTLKEAQNLMAPISLLLALPIILSMTVMGNPNGTTAVVLSFVPPFTPFIMMLRVASVPPPPVWQVAASLVLLAGSTFLAVRMAARIFRVGVLLHGQPPSLKQIWRWLRA
jgi:ABC-2 type transport system permease protein